MSDNKNLDQQADRWKMPVPVADFGPNEPLTKELQVLAKDPSQRNEHVLDMIREYANRHHLRVKLVERPDRTHDVYMYGNAEECICYVFSKHWVAWLACLKGTHA